MKNFHSFFILICLLISISCEKELDIDDLNYKAQIVLNGLIYPDSNIYINVTRSKSILEADSILGFLEHADVKLYKNDTFIENLVHERSGYFRSKSKTQLNVNYKIEASAGNLETAFANFSLSNKINMRIENIDYQIRDTLVEIDKPEKKDTSLVEVFLNFDLVFNDDPDAKNYYDFSGHGKFCSYRTHIVSHEKGYIEYKYLTENSDLYISFNNYGDAEKYYSGSAGYNGYEKNFFITDEIFNGEQHRFELFTHFYANNVDSIEIALYSYPYDYIKFHESGYRYMSSYYNPFSQPINIYSNVENGLGIVCGISCSKQRITFSN